MTVFAGSQFLSEILLRNPDYLPALKGLKHLEERKTPQRLYAEAQGAIAACERGEELSPLDALRRMQRAELLRIGVGDLLGLLDLSTVTAQLSHLADGLIQLCLDLVAGQAGVAGFVVVALGKLGGNELNYSSDIDLLFLCA